MSEERLKEIKDNIEFKTLLSKLPKEYFDYKTIEILANEELELYNEVIRLREALEIKYYCKYANKCNELYDCSKEEYEGMAECNMEMSNRINEAIEYIEKETKELYSKNRCCKYLGEIMQLEYVLNILRGEDK